MSCSIIPEAIHHPWELSLPGPWPDVHGAHLTYRASEDSQANGHGGPTTSLRRDAIHVLVMPDRSEERRVGKDCVSTCRFRWSPYPTKKTKYRLSHVE